MTVALAMSAELAASGGTSEDLLLASLLDERGPGARLEAWTGGADWERFDCILIRSCWDYHLRPDDFREWLDDLEGRGVTVWNQPSLLRWNVDKRYLLDLESRDVPIVPTLVRGSVRSSDVPLLARHFDSEELVIKPVIGATAHGCRRQSAALTASEEEVIATSGEGPWLIQPLVESILVEGEWSLMFFDGRFGYAVRKRPAPGEYRVQSEWGGSSSREVVDDEFIETGRAVLDALDSTPLYARVDLVRWQERPHLMELELIEPQLFLEPGDAALETLLERLSA